MTTMSDNALWIGCFCISRLMAAATQSPANRKKSAKWIIGSMRLFGPVECQHSSRNDDVDQRERQQYLPAEVHELVIAEAGQCAAYPDVEEDKAEHLDAEPEKVLYRFCQTAVEQISAERAVPPTKEQQSCDAACGEHIGVFRHKEHGKFHG